MTSSGDSAPEEHRPGCVRDPSPFEGPHRALEAPKLPLRNQSCFFLEGWGRQRTDWGTVRGRVGCIRSGAPEGPGLFIWEVRCDQRTWGSQVWWGTLQTAGLLFCLPGHPAISVYLSLVPAPKAHNPPDMGSVQQHRGCVHSQVGPIPSKRRRKKQASENLLEPWWVGGEGKREPEAFLMKRPQIWTNTGGGDLGQEARLIKEPTAFRSQVGA